jgi:SAM-dependent methyltransferase
MRFYKLKGLAGGLLKRRGKAAFLASLKSGSKVLDVGCGNDSPIRFKSVRPDVKYVGLDIQDYNQSLTPSRVADDYLVVSPERFADEIARFPKHFDVIVSAHNLEHCNDPHAVLAAIVGALAAGGRLYLSFPCEASVGFPSRRGGCLNFHDDGSHRVPPDFQKVCDYLARREVRIDFAARRYRPALPFVLGLLLEPLSAVMNRIIPAGATWALYGFESVIWATKPKFE